MGKIDYKSQKQMTREAPQRISSSLRDYSGRPFYTIREVPFNKNLGLTFGANKYEMVRVN